MTNTTSKSSSVTIDRVDRAVEPDADARERLSELLPSEALDRALKGLSPDEITGSGGLLSQLAGRVIDAALGGELSDHLGYEPGQAPPGGAGNMRNGSTPKTVSTDLGPVEVNTPRDRNCSFEPQLVAKRQTRMAGLDAKIIDLYAGGMSVRDIQSHLERLYGTTAISGMPASQAGVAAAISSTSRQVGGTIGVAVAGAVVATGSSALSGADFTLATHAAWWLMVGFAAAMFIIAAVTTTTWAFATARATATRLETDTALTM